MIHLLKEYADKHLSVEPGFKPKTIKWAVMLDSKGNYLNVVRLGDTTQRNNPGRQYARCPEFPGGFMQGGGKAHPFVESAATAVLLLKDEDREDEDKLNKAKEKHTFFKDVFSKASSSMPELGLIASAMADEVTVTTIRNALAENKAKPADAVTFAVGDIYPVESDAWHDWWRNYRTSLSQPEKETPKPGKRAASAMVDFVTGDIVTPARTFPKIAGLSDVGGLGMGDAWVGFDKDAFCSFGLDQSTNAAMSEESATAVRDAMNHLIRNHGIRLAGAKVVHWFDKKVPKDDDALAWLVESPETTEAAAAAKARELLNAIREGTRTDLRDNHYYALTLSGMSGRVMVRDWMTGQFEELVVNVKDWFDNLSIVHRQGGGLAPSPKFFAILGATVRDLDMLAPPFVSKMWRVAVHNEPIPRDAMAKALARVRVDVMNGDPANHARMGLIKAYHIRKGDTYMTPYLNQDHPHPAYHCGRLMAVYAALQEAALGDVGAGVVQRFYAAASATPALVLGRLAKLGEVHLGALGKDKKGLSVWFENRIASIYGSIKVDPPAVLTLEEQSLFAIGYYQEMASKGSYLKKDENNGGAAN